MVVGNSECQYPRVPDQSAESCHVTASIHIYILTRVAATTATAVRNVLRLGAASVTQLNIVRSRNLYLPWRNVRLVSLKWVSVLKTFGSLSSWDSWYSWYRAAEHERLGQAALPLPSCQNSWNRLWCLSLLVPRWYVCLCQVMWVYMPVSNNVAMSSNVPDVLFLYLDWRAIFVPWYHGTFPVLARTKRFSSGSKNLAIFYLGTFPGLARICTLVHFKARTSQKRNK